MKLRLALAVCLLAIGNSTLGMNVSIEDIDDDKNENLQRTYLRSERKDIGSNHIFGDMVFVTDSNNGHARIQFTHDGEVKHKYEPKRIIYGSDTSPKAFAIDIAKNVGVQIGSKYAMDALTIARQKVFGLTDEEQTYQNQLYASKIKSEQEKREIKLAALQTSLIKLTHEKAPEEKIEMVKSLLDKTYEESEKALAEEAGLPKNFFDYEKESTVVILENGKVVALPKGSIKKIQSQPTASASTDDVDMDFDSDNEQLKEEFQPQDPAAPAA